MTVFKSSNVSVEIKNGKVDIGDVGVKFYTQDINTTLLNIRVLKDEQFLNFNDEQYNPFINLFMGDGSVFLDQPVEISDAENGLLTYKLADKVKHAGWVKFKLILKKEDESLHAANFKLEILDSGLESEIGRVIDVDILMNAFERFALKYPEKIRGKAFTYEDFTEEQLALLKGPKGDVGPKGEAGEVEDGSVTTEKVADNAITPQKTTFFTDASSNNLFDKETVQTNKTVDTDGAIVEDDSRWLSDYIALDSQLNEQLNFTQGSYRVALYDKDKKFIIRTGINNDTKYISNPLTKSKYVRLSGTTDLNTLMINKGEILLPFEVHHESSIKIKEKYLPNILGAKGEKGDKGDKGDIAEITKGSITGDKLADKTITPEKTTFFTGGVSTVVVNNNLFDISTVQKNKTVDTDGSIIEDSSRWLSDYIAVDSQLNEQINFTQGTYRIAMYDENKKFIIRSGITNNTFYVPSYTGRSKYVRLSGTTPLDKMMVNKGKELLPLESKEVTNTESTPIKMKKEYMPEITPEMLTIMETKVSNNLLNKKEVQMNKSIETDGTIIEDTSRWLTGFIPLDSQLNEQLNFTQGTYRIAMYNADKKFVIRSGVTDKTFYVPSYTSRTKYVRLSGTTNLDVLMINKGEKLLPHEDSFGTSVKLKEEYLPENIGANTNGNNALNEEIKNKLAKAEQSIQTYTPSVPKLNFEEVKTGYNEALWLSSDGKRIYGKRGSELWVSFDECENLTVIIADAKFSIQAVRELGDGELIFSTERDSAGRTQNGRVYKTKGFNKETGKIDSYEMKIETDSTEAKVNNSWGITTHNNIVTISEYGLRTEEGARRAWLSKDYGNTFKLIFDQKETTKLITGAPTWTETAHMHTCSFDPYWNRIWIVTGDRPNSATYYSDDFGETWKWVDVKFNGDVMQFTGIVALPNCVVFGSDRAPNGVFVYYRGNKSDVPQIVPLLLVNDSNIITHVFQLPFKKDWDSLSPVYFAATNAGETDNKSILVATVDGKKAFILHENNNNEKFGGKCTAFLGETAQGNVIGTFFDSDVSGYRIGKAKAPTWTKL